MASSVLADITVQTPYGELAVPVKLGWTIRDVRQKLRDTPWIATLQGFDLSCRGVPVLDSTAVTSRKMCLELVPTELLEAERMGPSASCDEELGEVTPRRPMVYRFSASVGGEADGLWDLDWFAISSPQHHALSPPPSPSAAAPVATSSPTPPSSSHASEASVPSPPPPLCSLAPQEAPSQAPMAPQLMPSKAPPPSLPPSREAEQAPSPPPAAGGGTDAEPRAAKDPGEVLLKLGDMVRIFSQSAGGQWVSGSVVGLQGGAGGISSIQVEYSLGPRLCRKTLEPTNPCLDLSLIEAATAHFGIADPPAPPDGGLAARGGRRPAGEPRPQAGDRAVSRLDPELAAKLNHRRRISDAGLGVPTLAPRLM